MFIAIAGAVACNIEIVEAPDIIHTFPVILGNDFNTIFGKEVTMFPVNLDNDFNIITSKEVTMFPVNLGNDFNTLFGVDKVVMVEEPEIEYFTSLVYPTLITESLKVSTPVIDTGFCFSIGDEILKVAKPTILDCELNETIVYRDNNSSSTKANVDTFKVNPPTMLDGELNETIVYKSNVLSPPVDTFKVNQPTMLDGELTVSITYITHQNPSADTFKVNPPTMLDGTLT